MAESSVTIWHNPRCSKSRETLALLESMGLTPTVRLYLEDAPSEAELEAVLAMLGVEPRALMRTKEDEYKAQGLAEVTGGKALVKAMAATPKLIERPIVFHAGKAAIGRPPEAVKSIL